MTYQDDFTSPTELLERIASIVQILVNAAMQIERQRHRGAGSYGRLPGRQRQTRETRPGFTGR